MATSPKGFCAIWITYRGLPSQIAKSAGADVPFVRKALRGAYFAVGRRWHRKIRPRHFDYGAAGKYGYMPRKRLYTKIKRDEVGHTKPLVRSGESEHATERATFKATTKGVTVSMDGGNITAGRETFERVGWFRGRQYLGSEWGLGAKLKRQRRVEPSQMEKELTSVTVAEHSELGGLADRVMAHYFDRLGGSHRIAV